MIQFSRNNESNNLKLVYLNPFSYDTVSSHEPMAESEKLPLEFLSNGDYENGLDAYLEIQRADKNDTAVNENRLNRKGYNLIADNNLTLAKSIFKVNTILYPSSSNVYDSYAEVCMMNKEYDLAIKNYQKSLELDPQNQNAQNMIDKMKSEL